MSDVFLRGLDGPAVEREVVGDIVRHGLMVTPPLLLVAGAIWGFHGALSAGYGMALILANFTIAALLMSWAARVSLIALAVAAFGGYILRLVLLTVAVLAVKDQTWVSMVPLALTIGITHLGLLFWETRYISATLAFPGLKPRTSKGA